MVVSWNRNGDVETQEMGMHLYLPIYTVMYNVSNPHVPFWFTLNRLRRNDRAMIRWICNVKAKDEVSSDSLLTKLDIQDLHVVLRTSRMRWFGHVERSTGWISEVRKLNVIAQKRSVKPRKSWDVVIRRDVELSISLSLEV